MATSRTPRLCRSAVFARSVAARLTTKTYDRLNRTRLGGQCMHRIRFRPQPRLQLQCANPRTRMTQEDNTYWSCAFDTLGQVTSGSKALADGTAAMDLAFV